MAEKDRVDITAVREVCVDGIPKYYIVPVYNDDTSEVPSYFNIYKLAGSVADETYIQGLIKSLEKRA